MAGGAGPREGRGRLCRGRCPSSGRVLGALRWETHPGRGRRPVRAAPRWVSSPLRRGFCGKGGIKCSGTNALTGREVLGASSFGSAPAADSAPLPCTCQAPAYLKRPRTYLASATTPAPKSAWFTGVACDPGHGFKPRRPNRFVPPFPAPKLGEAAAGMGARGEGRGGEEAAV